MPKMPVSEMFGEIRSIINRNTQSLKSFEGMLDMKERYFHHETFFHLIENVLTFKDEDEMDQIMSDVIGPYVEDQIRHLEFDCGRSILWPDYRSCVEDPYTHFDESHGKIARNYWLRWQHLMTTRIVFDHNATANPPLEGIIFRQSEEFSTLDARRASFNDMMQIWMPRLKELAVLSATTKTTQTLSDLFFMSYLNGYQPFKTLSLRFNLDSYAYLRDLDDRKDHCWGFPGVDTLVLDLAMSNVSSSERQLYEFSQAMAKSYDKPEHLYNFNPKRVAFASSPALPSCSTDLVYIRSLAEQMRQSKKILADVGVELVNDVDVFMAHSMEKIQASEAMRQNEAVRQKQQKSLY